MLYVLVALFALISHSLYAFEDCETLNIYAEKYHQEFDLSWENRSFECPSKLSKLTEAFYYLEHIKFDEKVERETPNFYPWIKNTLSEVEFDEDIRYKKSGVVGVAYFGTGLSKVSLKFPFLETNTMQRMATIIHEARHLEPDDPSHVICNHGRNQGKKACDRELRMYDWQGDSYSYDSIFFWFLKDSTQAHDLDRSLAKFYLKYNILNAFNKISNEDVKRFTK